MESSDRLLSGLKFFFINLLLLEHLLFILFSFVGKMFYSFINHIVNVFGLFVDDHSILILDKI